GRAYAGHPFHKKIVCQIVSGVEYVM
ncbi:MAG: hypothetical protein RIR17_626, partial [Planctomycetota bacterium]